jgi:hypothetical protein
MTPNNNSYYDSDTCYLHAGKQQLEGGKLTRYGKNGHDARVLFFCKDTTAGRWYVRHYGHLIHSCKINLSADQVFDFTNPTHRQKLQQRLSQREWYQQEWQRLLSYIATNGHPRWPAFERTQPFSPPSIDEQLFVELGFRGIVLCERTAGEQDAPEDILSIAVFNVDDIEIIGTES